MPSVRSPQSHCQVGVARGDITPPVGIYHRLWGAATHERATAVHRPLTATAVCFRPSEGDLSRERILIAVDHCLLWGGEQSRLMAGLVGRAQIPAESIQIAYSHTHSGGLIDLSRRDRAGGELLEPYLESLEAELARLIVAARTQARLALIVYGTARCDLAAHRDFFDEATQQIVCGFNPTGSGDDTVVVARMTAVTGETLATLVNYACHPTTLAWKNTQISPDFPGAMREVVEVATGAPCLFLQGASADLGPREGFVGDLAVADRNGRQLGYAALSGLTALGPPGTRFEYTGPVVSGATLGIWDWKPVSDAERSEMSTFEIRDLTVPLPYRPELSTVAEVKTERAGWIEKKQAAEAARDTLAARDGHAMIERMDRQLTRLSVLPAGPEFPFPVTLWRMGDAVWIGVEGELYQVFQRELRTRFPNLMLVITTLANGSRCSYLPEANAYGKGIYQESIALLAAGCLERLLDEVAWEIERLTR